MFGEWVRRLNNHRVLVGRIGMIFCLIVESSVGVPAVVLGARALSVVCFGLSEVK